MMGKHYTILSAALILFVLFTVSVNALPPGFQEETVLSSINDPVLVRFAPDGSVFVAQQAGQIFHYTSVSDTTPTLFADLRPEVDFRVDLGLLGLTVDPDYTNGRPYVYALFTIEDPAATDATKGNPGHRLVKLTASGEVSTAREVLLEGWCQSDDSHGPGDLHFGPDGNLYVSGGEGADHDAPDWGQIPSTIHPGITINCGDPAKEGGSLRSQDVQTDGDPAGYSGAILRIDPDTGDGVPGSPFFNSTDPNKRRIIAYGERNPYRFTFHPVTGEMWIQNTGSTNWEEINHIPDVTDNVAENFGWPCYEGNVPYPAFVTATNANDLTLCENLYDNPSLVTEPVITFANADRKASSGIVFYTGDKYPSRYEGALFVADIVAYYTGADPIRVIYPDENGDPDPNNIESFSQSAVGPVDLQLGPDGYIYYADLPNDRIVRLNYFGGTQPPVAVITADQTSGSSPLTVQFSAANSTDADAGDTLTFAWDLDNDGAFDDATGVTASRTFTISGAYTVRLLATDSANSTDVETIQILVDVVAPTATIINPTTTTTYKVGDIVSFSGEGTDPNGNPMDPSTMSWAVDIQHCDFDNGVYNCHTHANYYTVSGVSSGSFAVPDHEYPSHLDVRFTVSDGPQNWWESEWQYRKRLSFNTAGITQPVTNIPVLVRLDSTFDYDLAGDNGEDIRFVDQDNTTLPYEIESWNDNGESIIWVLVPQINAGSGGPDFISMYYGNPAAVDAQDAETVWSNDYELVYHMDQDGSFTPDSSGNGRDGLIVGATEAPGFIGNAFEFNGVDNLINTLYSDELGSAGSWSISLWAKLDPDVVCDTTDGNDLEGTNIFVKEWDYRIYLKDTCMLGFITRAGDWQPGRIDLESKQFEVGSSFPSDDWHHIMYVWNQDTATTSTYYDGIYDAGDESNTSLESVFTTPGIPFHIGGQGGAAKFFNGLIDDVTIASAARSASWAAAEYASESGQLFTVGAQEVYDPNGGSGSELFDTTTVAIYPQTVNLTFTSIAPGLEIGTYNDVTATPFNLEVIINAVIDVSAPLTQFINGIEYEFDSWSDGGAASHSITAPATPTIYTALYNTTNPASISLTTSPGGARVFLGSTSTTVAGTTDVTTGAFSLSNLAPGAFDAVRIFLPGYVTVLQPVTLTAGQNTDLGLFNLVPLGPVTSAIDSPADGSTFTVGNTITFSGSGTAGGNPLQSDSYEWQTTLVTCDSLGVCTRTPQQSFIGPSGSFAAYDPGMNGSIELKLSTVGSSEGTTPWWHPEWTIRNPITIDTSGLTGDVTDMRVLIQFDATTVDYSQALTQNGAKNLRFIDENNTSLDYDIDTWNPGGTSSVWVRLPTASASAPKQLYMYYGNPFASETQYQLEIDCNVGEPCKARTWGSDFELVYHMNLGLPFDGFNYTLDSSGNNRNGQIRKAAYPSNISERHPLIVNEVTGVVGNSLEFGGFGDFVTSGYAENLNDGWTVSLWAKMADETVCDTADGQNITGSTLFTKDYDYRIFQGENCKYAFGARNGDWQESNGKSGVNQASQFEVGTPEDKQWHYITYTWDPAQDKILVYFDGVFQPMVVGNETIEDLHQSVVAFTVGASEFAIQQYYETLGNSKFPNGPQNLSFAGAIDEVRLASTSLSADEIAADYASQNGIATVEASESAGGSAPGLTTVTHTVMLQPETTQISFAAQTLSGTALPVAITAYGQSQSAPYTLNGVPVNGNVSISAQPTVVENGTTYTFSHWTDGSNASSRVATIPSGGTTYTAIYLAGNESVGFIRVTTNPSGATISIDGVEQSEESPATYTVAPGTYDVSASLTGRNSDSETVTVTAGATVDVELTLSATTTRRGGGGGGGGGARRPVVTTNSTNNTTTQPTGGDDDDNEPVVIPGNQGTSTETQADTEPTSPNTTATGEQPPVVTGAVTGGGTPKWLVPAGIGVLVIALIVGAAVVIGKRRRRMH